MRAARATTIALGITIAMILTSAGTAGAFTGAPATGADACAGTTKVDLASIGIRLLNADGERTYGPIAALIPSGVYSVALASWDRHDELQVTQPEEQWRVVADTGWSSPLSADIPDDVDRVVSTFDGLAIASPIASITIVHKGSGIINSVSPMCVGFTRTGDIPAVAPPVDAGDGEDTVDSEIGGPEGGADDPSASDDTDGTGDPDDPSGGDDTDGESEDADGSATSIVRPPDDSDADGTSDSTDDTNEDSAGDDPSADGTSDSIEVEVEGQVELPPVLARTGPSLTTIAAIVAAAFVLLGGYALGWQRRLEFTNDET